MRIAAYCFCALLLTCSASTALVAAESTAAPSTAQKQDQIATLIEQLDDERFVKRESAEKQLLVFGVAAMDQIKAATKHYNAEIRYRAQRLLTILTRRTFADYMDSLDRRVAAFLRGDSDALPGWKQFASSIGNDEPEVRKLFAEMHLAEPKLLWTYSNMPSDLAAAWLNCKAEHERDRRRSAHGAPLDTLAAMQWIALEKDLNVSDKSKAFLNGWWRRHKPEKVKENSAMVTLLKAWLRQPITADGTARIQCIGEKDDVAIFFGFEHEALSLSIELLKSGGQIQGFQQANIAVKALTAFAMFGNADHIKHVEPLLDDKTICRQMRNVQVQVRDVALGVLVLLSDQDFADYHLKKPNIGRVRLNPLVFEFKNAEHRDAALARWQAWSKENR